MEARVESARRASEIHKRRTGRSLRVTEQDVVNEEMYEEEDDDLPMQYRRLTAHLQTQNADFDRRLQAYLTNHVAMRTALGQAVSDAWQQNNPNHFQGNNQFMNPGMMQMQQPQPGYHGPMMPSQSMFNRSPANYRQSPYPMPNQTMPGMRSQFHNRSGSMATPQEISTHHQQHQQSAQTSSVEAAKINDRRTSLPAQNLPCTLQSQNGSQQTMSPTHMSPVISRSGSSTNLATPQAYHQSSQSPQQVPTPPEQQQQPHRHRQQPMTSPFTAAFEQQMNGGFGPLSMSLPMESQQLLAGSSAFNMNDPMTSMFMPSQNQSQSGMKPQQPFYSYNPNGKPKNSTNSPQTTFDGLSQTLAPSSLDTSVGGCDTSMYLNTPQSGAIDGMFMPYGSAGFTMGTGYDNGFGVDPHNVTASGNTSGHVTPVEADWPNFLDENAFLEQPLA